MDRDRSCSSFSFFFFFFFCWEREFSIISTLGLFWSALKIDIGEANRRDDGATVRNPFQRNRSLSLYLSICLSFFLSFFLSFYLSIFFSFRLRMWECIYHQLISDVMRFLYFLFFLIFLFFFVWVLVSSLFIDSWSDVSLVS